MRVIFERFFEVELADVQGLVHGKQLLAAFTNLSEHDGGLLEDLDPWYRDANRRKAATRSRNSLRLTADR